MHAFGKVISPEILFLVQRDLYFLRTSTVVECRVLAVGQRLGVPPVSVSSLLPVMVGGVAISAGSTGVNGFALHPPR